MGPDGKVIGRLVEIHGEAAGALAELPLDLDTPGAAVSLPLEADHPSL
jgi:hypothetical protein